MSALPLAKRMFRLSLPLDIEEKLKNFENQIFNEARYREIVEGVKKVLDLDDKRESAIYKKFIQILQIEYLRVYVSPEDYNKMIRFTENAIVVQNEERLSVLEELKENMQRANEDVQEYTKDAEF